MGLSVSSTNSPPGSPRSTPPPYGDSDEYPTRNYPLKSPLPRQHRGCNVLAVHMEWEKDFKKKEGHLHLTAADLHQKLLTTEEQAALKAKQQEEEKKQSEMLIAKHIEEAERLLRERQQKEEHLRLLTEQRDRSIRDLERKSADLTVLQENMRRLTREHEGVVTRLQEQLTSDRLMKQQEFKQLSDQLKAAQEELARSQQRSERLRSDAEGALQRHDAQVRTLSQQMAEVQKSSELERQQHSEQLTHLKQDSELLRMEKIKEGTLLRQQLELVTTQMNDRYQQLEKDTARQIADQALWHKEVVNQLNALVGERKEEVDNLRKQVARLELQLSQVRDQGIVESTRDRELERQRVVQELNQLKEKAEHEVRLATEKIASREQEIAAHMQKVSSDHEHIVQQLYVIINERAREIADLKGELDKLKGVADSKVHLQEERWAKMLEERNTERAAKDELIRALRRQLDTDREGLEDKYRKRELVHEQLIQTLNTDHTRTLQQNEETIRTLQQEIRALRQREEEHAHEIAELRRQHDNQLKSYQDMLGKNEEALELARLEYERALAETNARHDEIVREGSALMQEISTKSDEQAAELTASRQKVQELVLLQSASDARMRALEDQLRVSEDARGVLVHENERVNAELSSRTAQFQQSSDRLSEENATLKQRIQDSEARQNELEEAVKSTEQALKTTEDHLKSSIQALNSAHEQQTKQLQDTLENSNQSLLATEQKHRDTLASVAELTASLKQMETEYQQQATDLQKELTQTHQALVASEAARQESDTVAVQRLSTAQQTHQQTKDELEQQIARLQQQVAAATADSSSVISVANKQIADLQSEMAQLQKQHHDAQQRVSNLEAEQKASHKDHEIKVAQLQLTNVSHEKDLAALKQRLIDAESELSASKMDYEVQLAHLREVIEELNQEIERLKKLLQEKEGHITHLISNLRDKDEQLNAKFVEAQDDSTPQETSPTALTQEQKDTIKKQLDRLHELSAEELMQLADQGIVEAAQRLADMLLDGTFDPDYKLALKYLKVAGHADEDAQLLVYQRLKSLADQGNTRAQAQLGLAHLDHEHALTFMDKQGKTHDYHMAQAALWLRQSAEHGDKEGSLHLGNCYVEWLGVPIDFKEARKWYNQAGKSNDWVKKRIQKKIDSLKQYYKKLFDLYDTDGDGQIAIEEFRMFYRDCLRALGHTKQQADQRTVALYQGQPNYIVMFKDYDQDRTRSIEFEEIWAHPHTHTALRPSTSEALMAAIKFFNRRSANLEEKLHAADEEDAEKSPEEEHDTYLAILKEQFDKFDVDKSGFLDRAEITKLLKDMYQPSEEKVTEVLNKFDKNHDGTVSFQEFVVGMRRISPERAKKSEPFLLALFSLFDEASAGYLTRDQLTQLIRYDLSVPEEAVSRAMEMFDSDGDQQITFPEFAANFQKIKMDFSYLWKVKPRPNAPAVMSPSSSVPSLNRAASTVSIRGALKRSQSNAGGDDVRHVISPRSSESLPSYMQGTALTAARGVSRKGASSTSNKQQLAFEKAVESGQRSSRSRSAFKGASSRKGSKSAGPPPRSVSSSLEVPDVDDATTF